MSWNVSEPYDFTKSQYYKYFPDNSWRISGVLVTLLRSGGDLKSWKNHTFDDVEVLSRITLSDDVLSLLELFLEHDIDEFSHLRWVEVREEIIFFQTLTNHLLRPGTTKTQCQFQKKLSSNSCPNSPDETSKYSNTIWLKNRIFWLDPLRINV